AVALSGRVPVKVSTVNGPIESGDYLTTSSILGVAMKATYAGPVIGQAMTGYNSETEEIGTVAMFIKLGYYNGENISSILGNYTPEILPGLENIQASFSATQIESTTDRLFSLTVLDYLLNTSQSQGPRTDLSEIMTDRLVAGLEVITPQIIAQSAILESIQPLSDTLTFNLTEDGRIDISSGSGEPVITFDAFGNARFAGTITADKVQASQIEGLEIFTDKISSLSNLVSSISSSSSRIDLSGDMFAIDSDNEISLDDYVWTKAPFIALRDIQTENFEASGSAVFRGSVIVDNVLTIIKKLIVSGETVLEKTLTVLGDTVLKGKVKFNTDTAGKAVIPKYSLWVEVPFEAPFEEKPVIMLTLDLPEATDSAFLADGVKAAVAGVKKDRFTIVLDSPAPRDLEYNWFAFTVDNMRKVSGKAIPELSERQDSEPETTVLGDDTDVLPDPTQTPVPKSVEDLMQSVPTATPIPTVVPVPIPLSDDIEPQPTTKPKIPSVVVKVNDYGFVKLRKDVDAESEELDQIPVGEIVPYTDEKFSWYRVVYKGQTGWVSGMFVEVIVE
ncbi:SH3 domain-containing protein, partial [Patescibacteria group bacterium]